MYIDGPHFKDSHGRTLMLRGVNLGGSSKVPARPNGATHLREKFFDHRTVSFVGRPFPLEEADEHLGRLRRWGFTFLRFLVTWEAIDTRTIKPVFLPRAIRRSFADQLAFIKAGSTERLGGAPVVLGEFGIPFDMHEKAAYRDGDFSRQEAALDRSLQALEANLLHGTLWNYTPDNTNERGDLWNGEDLSIFSRDQQADPDSGGRALRAAVRPYPVATAGEALRLRFDMKRRAFEYTFRHDPAVIAPTEIYVPALQYPEGPRVEISDGRYELRPAEQVLLYWHGAERAEHTIRLASAG